MESSTLLEIAKKARSGDKTAQTAIVRRFEPFLRSQAKRLSSSVHGIAEADDLFQAGSIGLLSALYTFDPSKGVKLSTFAIFHIKKSMLMFVRSQKPNRKFEPLSNEMLESVPEQSKSPHEAYTVADDIRRVQRVVCTTPLCEKQRALLSRRLMSDTPESLKALGVSFGVSGEMMRKNESALKLRLRKLLRNK